MLKELLAAGDQRVAQPEIDGERCVHGASALASCDACVRACPSRAWVLDDDGLSLDLDACDGCGLCVPACPEEAIHLAGERPQPLRPSDGAAMVACRPIAPAVRPDVLPCLHALGLRELLRFHAAGGRRLVVAHGDCRSCRPTVEGRLPGALDQVNRLLASRGLQPVALVDLEPAEWRAAARWTGGPASGTGVSRRGLFDAVRRRAAAAPEPDDAADDPAPGALLPCRSASDLLPLVPKIDPQACVGCDVCVRMCPHGALDLVRDDGDLSYRVTPARCTGCGLCADVCEVGAIEVLRWAEPEQRQVPLAEDRCRACGNPYHHPSASPEGDGLCRICARTNHHRVLYQVLD